MKRLAIIMVLVGCFALPARADFTAGVKAYKQGDYATAMREFRVLADQGHRGASYNVAVMYNKGLGVKQDFGAAVKWYRIAAEKGYAKAQSRLGALYAKGRGVARDDAEAVKWWLLAADSGNVAAQFNLGAMYAKGRGVGQNYKRAEKWYRRAGGQGYAKAQFVLGAIYYRGRGVAEDKAEAAKWYRLAAKQGHGKAQFIIGVMYYKGEGVAKNNAEAYFYLSLAAKKDIKNAAKVRDRIGPKLTAAELASVADRVENWRPLTRKQSRPAKTTTRTARKTEGDKPKAVKRKSMGTGFFIGLRGQVLTSRHVVKGCARIRVRYGDRAGFATRRIVDRANDLAVVETRFVPATIASFRTGPGIRPGDSVVAIGFPLRRVLAHDAIVTTGTVSALAGPRNNRSLMQITAPVQKGNSGGPVLDLGGNVVGIVVSKLDALKIARKTGDLPQNVNFAVNGSVARIFLDAEGIKYRIGTARKSLSAAEVAARARKYTVLLECWK
ncbi:MAG: tetratricopeptide repeat-containing serine protease family protein [Alphaproteobacteria bacterium]